MNKNTVWFIFFSVFLWVPVSLAADLPAPLDRAYPGTISLNVEATDLAHRIFRVQETIPVESGPLTLLYPAWIPGYHSPTGPIEKLAGLKISGNGEVIRWERDQKNVFAFHILVPKGVKEIHLEFQFLSPQTEEQGRVVMTPEMLNLQWNTVALYPAGFYTSKIQVEASVKIPDGWRLATALKEKHRKGNRVKFNVIDFENLVDSPVFAGKYFRQVDLDPGAKIPVYLNIFADKAKDLNFKDEELIAHRNLIQQTYKLYGSQHYDRYDFLLGLTDKLGDIGMEHHRSSENTQSKGYFSKWDENWIWRDLLAHEFNHSWNGKYRRPTGMWMPTFNQIKSGWGLWLYEGQTQYWGFVLTARSGLWTQEQTLDRLALVGARYDKGRPGMQWRNIHDTTNDPAIAQRAPLAFRNYQMSEEYYSGGMLIWLAVDGKLRELSSNTLNLDHFGKEFFGVSPGAGDVDTYEHTDIIATLNSLIKYSWTDYIDTLLKGHGNLSQSFNEQGWELIYKDKPSDASKSVDTFYKEINFLYSLGFLVKEDGKLQDVVWDSVAFNAGLSSSMTIVAVNGEEFTGDLLKEAVTESQKNTSQIELLVKDFNQYQTLTIDYHDGLKYPYLERIKGKEDYLSQILTAR